MIGGRTRARTWDPLIKSQLLYQLSYAPGLPSAGSPARRGSLSKGAPGCPAAPGSPSQSKQRKSRRAHPAASRVRESTAAAARYALLRLPRAAFGSHRAAIGPVIAAMHPAAHPVLAALAAFAAEFVSAEPGERVEAMLLALVQALVERTGRVGEFLERGAALRHRVGAQGQPFDLILRTIGAGMGGEPLGALLGKIAQRAFHRRPIFLLLGVKLEPGVQSRDPRVAVRADVLRARVPARRIVASAGTLLRVGERSAGESKRGRSGQNSLPHGIPPMAFLMTPIMECRAAFSS